MGGTPPAHRFLQNRAESSNVYVRYTGRSNTCKSIDPKERDNSVLESFIDGVGGGSKKAPGALWGLGKAARRLHEGYGSVPGGLWEGSCSIPT